MSNVTVKQGTAVARPLKVLTELIKEDFRQAEEAGMPYFKAAGEKLNEARDGHYAERPPSEFYTWAEQTFGKKRTQIRTYMALATTNVRKSFKSLEDFQKREFGYPRQTTDRVYREWTAPVDSIAHRAQNEARRLIDTEAMTQRQERQAEAQLGLRLIDIGWKVLAKELHPDKVGGSREAMRRLNRVRDRLKANV